MTIIESAPWPSDPRGFSIRAELIHDPFTRREDYECYEDPEVIANWESDLWHFMDLVVIASRGGIDLGRAVLGGVEYGYLSKAIGWASPLDEPEAYADQVDEAVAEAEDAIRKITDINTTA